MSAEFRTIKQLATEERQNKSVSVFGGCWLHYNGPGSSGYGVKRTAMLLPESAMLMVGPMGCSRSGTVVAEKNGFAHRMFYLNLDDRSISLGSYLKKIPEAVQYIKDLGEFKAVLICMTCLDALLGTDLAGLGRKISRQVGIPVTTTFMDPIVRDGNYGPMVQVRQAITNCFDAQENASDFKDAINLLGTFAPLENDSELFSLLKGAGINKIKTVAGCRSFEELQGMGGSRANLIVHPQAAECGADLEKRLGMPYIKLYTSYVPNIIEDNYKKLGSFLGARICCGNERQAAEKAIKEFALKYKGRSIAVGEAVCGNPFDIALMLINAGIEVPFVFRDMIHPEDWDLIAALNKTVPELKVYSGVHPSTAACPATLPEAHLMLGLDAGYFNKDAISAAWPFDRTFFGFDSIHALLGIMDTAFTTPRGHREQMKGTYLTV
jgi:nitrogenase molybdenum-cofactor synthesis protein NifE